MSLPTNRQANTRPVDLDRRGFISKSVAATTALATTLSTPNASSLLANEPIAQAKRVFQFDSADSLFHGHDWQTLNPGFWKVENGALRRRLKNYGDRARRTGFPFHGSSHGFDYKTQYDPSLSSGLIYLPHWKLKGAFTLKAEFTFRGGRPDVPDGDDPNWKMYQDGYGVMGIALGAKSLFESYGKVSQAVQIAWTDDVKLNVIRAGGRKKGKQGGIADSESDPTARKLNLHTPAMQLASGDKCTLVVTVRPVNKTTVSLETVFKANGKTVSIIEQVPRVVTEGYVGITSRGLIDFEVNSLEIDPQDNLPLQIGTTDCLCCYPLGDSLKQVDNQWTVRFVGMFASDGKQIEIRVSDEEQPADGWQSVAVCGTAAIVNNDWRRNTAVVDVALPMSPAEKTLYYTVWKDGVDVTADGRVGTDACGPGTGLVGDLPNGGQYVGRLPQLIAPYKFCGLSCHAITSGLQQRSDEGWKILGHRDDWQFRDQPTTEAYRHLDDYNFQVMVWEDDVWYMELVMYPPSTDDAYKIVALSICGPTSRWQMMRHWNVLNPGDHDYGMDDVKGPEQIAIRKHDGLGQDPMYMRRNFQIVDHLTRGAEHTDPLANPKKWRSWKMPNRDFTFIVLDSRLWRSSQDVDMWDDAGWGAFKSLYDRTDPTRSLLGEEQFGWLQEWLSTDSSPLIGVTGISGLHTVWTGAGGDSATHPMKFDQRDRVVADYAGWVKAGADRVLELFGARDGIVTVYGDVHNGCIMKNLQHRLIECSFGPIGRSGGRGCIPGFGRQMQDVDGRDLEVNSLYHKSYANASLQGHEKGAPFYWNFLEMSFDPKLSQPRIELRLRNLVDPPTADPRGGTGLETTAAETGRIQSCSLPRISTLPNADVFLTTIQGHSIRGARSDSNGLLHLPGLVDIDPGTRIVVTAFDGTKSDSLVVQTLPLRT